MQGAVTSPRILGAKIRDVMTAELSEEGLTGDDALFPWYGDIK